MKREAFDYQYPNGTMRGFDGSVKAYRTATAGLIVTPYAPLFDDDNQVVEPKPQAHDWVITHEKTGAKLLPTGVYLSRRVAFLVAGALGGAYDWTQITEYCTSQIAGAAEALRQGGLYTWLRERL